MPGLGEHVWSWGGCMSGPREVCLVLGVCLVQGACPTSGGVWLGGMSGPGVCVWTRGHVQPRGRGVSGWGGMSGPRGVCLDRGVCLVRYSPPVNRMIDRCKNITLAKTSFRPVMINNSVVQSFEFFHNSCVIRRIQKKINMGYM